MEYALGWLLILIGVGLGYYSGFWFEARRYGWFITGQVGMLSLVFFGAHLCRYL